MRNLLLVIALSLICLPAHAHLLKIFATVQSDLIKGSVYFSGSGAAPGAKVTVTSDDDTVLAQLVTDKEGHFSYATTVSSNYMISAKTGDGHYARWSVVSATPELAHSSKKQAINNSTIPINRLEEVIARQLAPLQKQIVTLEERLKFQDLLGAIGYIIGLAGLGAWYQSRQKNASPADS